MSWRSSGGVTSVTKPQHSSLWNPQSKTGQLLPLFNLILSWQNPGLSNYGLPGWKVRAKHNRRHAITHTHKQWHCNRKRNAYYSLYLIVCHAFLCLNLRGMVNASQWPVCQQASGSRSVTGCGLWCRPMPHYCVTNSLVKQPESAGGDGELVPLHLCTLLQSHTWISVENATSPQNLLSWLMTHKMSV